MTTSAINPTELPQIDARRCTGCGECERRCPTNAVALVAGSAVIARPEACTFCDRCERSCPEEAISRRFSISFAAPVSDPPGAAARPDRKSATRRAPAGSARRPRRS